MRRFVEQRAAIGGIAHVDHTTGTVGRERGDRLAEMTVATAKLNAVDEIVSRRGVVSRENGLAEEGALVPISRDLPTEPGVAGNYVDAWRGGSIGDECHLRGSARRRHEQPDRADGGQSPCVQRSAPDDLPP